MKKTTYGSFKFIALWLLWVSIRSYEFRVTPGCSPVKKYPLESFVRRGLNIPGCGKIGVVNPCTIADSFMNLRSKGGRGGMDPVQEKGREISSRKKQ